MHDVDLALEYSTRIVGIKDGIIALDMPSEGLTQQNLDFLYKETEK